MRNSSQECQNMKKYKVIITSIFVTGVLKRYFIPISNNGYCTEHNCSISNFKSLDDIIQNQTCFINNQLRPINAFAFPEYESVIPKFMIHSKYLFHGNVMNFESPSELRTHFEKDLNAFPQFLRSGKQIVTIQEQIRSLLYEHWQSLGFVTDTSNFIDVDDLDECENIFSFFPIEKYDRNIAETYKFFTKTYLPAFGIPLVENTTTCPMMVKCAELDSYDEGVYFIENDSDLGELKNDVTCIDWIHQKYIQPNPFSTADVNFYIHKNKSFSFIGVSPEVYREIGTINLNSPDVASFWLSHFHDIISTITFHITRVSNYSGHVCFSALRDFYGTWKIVDVNVRLCGGSHHFMISNIMKDRNFSFWQYFDMILTTPGVDCNEIIHEIEAMKRQSICKGIVTSTMKRNSSCQLSFMLFGTSPKTLSQCMPVNVFNWTMFDPWEIKKISNNKILNDMMPLYLLNHFK